MPNILSRSELPLSLDEIRDNPGRLYGRRDVARTGVVTSHDGIRSLVTRGLLPKPIRIGSRDFWEGRAILKLLDPL